MHTIAEAVDLDQRHNTEPRGREPEGRIRGEWLAPGGDVVLSTSDVHVPCRTETRGRKHNLDMSPKSRPIKGYLLLVPCGHVAIQAGVRSAETQRR